MSNVRIKLTLKFFLYTLKYYLKCVFRFFNKTFHAIIFSCNSFCPRVLSSTHFTECHLQFLITISFLTEKDRVKELEERNLIHCQQIHLLFHLPARN